MLEMPMVFNLGLNFSYLLNNINGNDTFDLLCFLQSSEFLALRYDVFVYGRHLNCTSS